MERRMYLNLAKSGLAMPIGTDLVLHEQPDPEAIVGDGERLGQLMIEAAARYHTPLAFPVMNLELEKRHLLDLLEVPTSEPATFHFSGAPGPAALQQLEERLARPLSEPMQALCGALSYVRDHSVAVPVGMCIGPFSLMTKLLSDPITPIAMAGMGMTAAEEPGITAVEQVLELATKVIMRYIEAQIAAGAKAIFICEPAANRVYLSPNQIERGSDIFERFVMQHLLQIRYLLLEQDADLLLHDCGELSDYMVEQFARLDPAILSLGSSRVLWEEAQLLPKDIVLFGNLPSKRFFSDAEITTEQVRQMGLELIRRMRATGHPFILGTECDLLHVPGCEQQLRAKARAVVECGLEAQPRSSEVVSESYAAVAST